MSAARGDLHEALFQYTTDTLTYINTVSEFCEENSSWEKALSKLNDIKDKADKIDLSFSHVTKAEKKGKALKEYVKSQVSADKRRAELEEELTDVLRDTLGGLQKLDHFLEAVEMLAVTSLHVFMEENEVLHLPGEISLEHVQVVIIASRLICPLLLKFKRDASDFFLPKLQNVEVLSDQLNKYIKTTQIICEKLKQSDPCWWMDNKPRIDLDADLSEDKTQGMLRHINQLNAIRMDQNFRLVFLFRDVSCSGFISAFKERQPRMLQFLTELEEVADQLDKMNMGAKISNVASSSVSAVGNVLSIVGLALLPVTAGVSLGLSIGGTVHGLTSGVNSVVTTSTEIGVNSTQQNKASEVFQRFTEDVQSLQECLEEVISQPACDIPLESEWAKSLEMGLAAGSDGKSVKSLDDSDLKSLKTENLNTSAEMDQTAVKGFLAARVGSIGHNALFSGMNIRTIWTESNSLVKGSETKVSKFIRARVALWSSEIDSWKKIHDSLCEGQTTSEEHRAVLDETFYPERAIKNDKIKKRKKKDCVVQ